MQIIEHEAPTEFKATKRCKVIVSCEWKHAAEVLVDKSLEASIKEAAVDRISAPLTRGVA